MDRRVQEAIIDVNAKISKEHHLAPVVISRENTALISQRQLTAFIDSKRFTELFSRSTPRVRALLLATSSNHANAWLKAPYNSCPRFWMSAPEFRVLVRRRLGMALIQRRGTCQHCNAAFDIFGDHATICSFKGFLIDRHEELKREIGKLLREAGFHVTVEERCNFEDEKD